MKYQRIATALLLGLILGRPTSQDFAWGQQPAGNRPVAGPVQQVARGNERTAPGSVANAAAHLPIMAPSWIPLTPEHQAYLDQILAYWEHKSSQTERYRCTFKRWEYDPVFGPKDTFKLYSEGVIKYSAPDKGLFRVDRQFEYRAAKAAGEAPRHEEQKAAAGSFDHWICDGRFVYQFDQLKKRLVQNELPPEVRGKAIGKGPLPFLFNAKSEDIKARFWLQVITPKDAQGEYWLEAVPQLQEDAANFKKVHLVIDGADYLPKAMILFSNNSGARTTFQFNDREVNFSILAEQLNLFHREFYEPKLPAGWEREVNRMAASLPATVPQSAPAGPPAANPPAARR